MARLDGPNFSMASFPGAKRVTTEQGRKWFCVNVSTAY